MEHVIFWPGKSNFKLHQHQWIGRYYRVAIDSISCLTTFFITKNDRDSMIISIIKLFLRYHSGPFRFGRDFRWYRISILHILLLRAWYQLHNVSSYRGFFCLCAQYLVHFLLHRLGNKHVLDWTRLVFIWALIFLTFLINKIISNYFWKTYWFGAKLKKKTCIFVKKVSNASLFVKILGSTLGSWVYEAKLIIDWYTLKRTMIKWLYTKIPWSDCEAINTKTLNEN